MAGLVVALLLAGGVSHFAFGTPPFMSACLGLYFLQPLKDRQSKPLSHKVGWAAAATASAVMVELPFDKAKISMAGHSSK